MKNVPSLKLVALSMGVVAAANLASAQTVTYTYSSVTAGGEVLGIQVGAHGGPEQIGEFNLTTSNPNFISPLKTYCTDVGVDLNSPFNYTPTALSAASGVSPAWISGGIQNAATLWFDDRLGATTAAQTAGLQLAIWELLYNPLAGSYSIATFENPGNGGFYVTTTDAGSLAAMNAAVADLNGFSSLTPEVNQVEWLAPTDANGAISGSQGLFYLIPNGVPEATSTLALFGLAMVGLGFAKRKLSNVQS